MAKRLIVFDAEKDKWGIGRMELSIEIDTTHPTIVASYLHGILEQMKQNEHFFIRKWKIGPGGGLERLETEPDSNLITVRNMKTAEAVKLFETGYADVNTALANEFALFCEKIGIDFIEVMKAANTQPSCRLFSPAIVSGHISKNPYLLVEAAESVDAKLRMTSLARRINDGMLRQVLRLTRDAVRQCEKTLRRTKIVVFGVSCRPNVKDGQGSSTKELVDLLLQKGASVEVYDPLFTHKELIGLGYPAERTLTKTVEGADCLIIAVGHDRFKRLNLKRIKLLVKRPAAIVDMGRVINPARAEKEGFVYRGVGRGVQTT